jgi:hypothetical protein
MENGPEASAGPMRHVTRLRETVMRSSLARHLTHMFGELFLAQPGASGRLMLSLTMAGGIGGGGVLIGALALTGVVEPGVQLFAAEALFVVGAFAGFVYAVALGIADDRSASPSVEPHGASPWRAWPVFRLSCWRGSSRRV